MFYYNKVGAAELKNEKGKVVEVVGKIDQENRNIGVNSHNKQIHQ
jgi:hypothetical protein